MNQPEATESLRGLLELARAGDAQALGLLAERCREPLLERIRLMLGAEARRSADSLDFVQGVLLEVVDRPAPARLRDEADALRWLTAIARNNIRDATRRRRERALASLSATLSGVAGRREPSPSAEAELHEDVLKLVEGLGSIAEHYREVIELRDLKGLSFAEIGARTGRSADAAQMLHTRALTRLGMVLGDG